MELTFHHLSLLSELNFATEVILPRGLYVVALHPCNAQSALM
jgi:hypothetical protein